MRNLSAGPAGVIDLLRLQSHRLTNKIAPFTLAEAEGIFGYANSDFHEFIEKSLKPVRYKAQAKKIIAEACAINPEYDRDQVARLFFIESILDEKFWGEIRTAADKLTPSETDGWAVFDKLDDLFEWFSSSNQRTKQLPHDLLYRRQAGEVDPKKEKIEKTPRTMRFSPHVDDIINMAAAAADVTNTEFVENLVRHYSDSLLRGYIYNGKERNKKNALDLYDKLKKRYRNVATFVNEPLPMQTGAALGPDGKKYDPTPATNPVVPKEVSAGDLMLEINKQLRTEMEILQKAKQAEKELRSLEQDALMNENNHEQLQIIYKRFLGAHGDSSPNNQETDNSKESDLRATA